jgi:hypothetical protein
VFCIRLCSPAKCEADTYRCYCEYLFRFHILNFECCPFSIVRN